MRLRNLLRVLRRCVTVRFAIVIDSDTCGSKRVDDRPGPRASSTEDERRFSGGIKLAEFG